MTKLISACPAFFQSGFFLQQSDKNNKSKDFAPQSSCFWLIGRTEFLTNSPQYKNASVANFVLVVSLETNYKYEVCNLEI